MNNLTVKQKILGALDLFWQKLNSVVCKYTDVVNNLTSTSTTLPLSAAQGKSLQDQVNTLSREMSSFYSDLSLNSNFNGSGQLRVITIGYIRILYGYLRPNAAGANQLAATLDSKDKPPIGGIYGSVNGYSVNTYGEISIDSSGRVYISVNAVPNNSLKFNIPYAIR